MAIYQLCCFRLGLKTVSQVSMRFGLYTPVKDALANLMSTPKGSEPFLLKLLAGIGSGTIGSSLANPTDLVKVCWKSAFKLELCK